MRESVQVLIIGGGPAVEEGAEMAESVSMAIGA